MKFAGKQKWAHQKGGPESESGGEGREREREREGGGGREREREREQGQHAASLFPLLLSMPTLKVYPPPPTRWSARVSLTSDSGVSRDHICTAYGPQVKHVRHVDF